MAKINIEFMDDGSGFCSKIEDDLELRVLRSLSLKTKKYENGLDVYEQISEWRHSVLEWYDFERDASLLEIGAGMGALTGLFLNKVSRVVCIENKKSRCDILQQRFSEEGIEIVNENYAYYDTDERFDYIVAHDIVGYIKKYFGRQASLNDFFYKVKKFLKPNGKLLLLTENRIGMKYFSGECEDYSEKFFQGLNDFDGYDLIRTYSKSELIQSSEKAGFLYHRFYYPYPDLTFTTQIFTDEIFDKVYYGGINKSVVHDSLSFFDEQRVLRTLQREGVVDKFANAFIVELSEQEIPQTMVYYKMNPNYPYGLYQDVYKHNPIGVRMDKYVLDILDKQIRNDMTEKDNLENVWELFYKCLVKVRNEKRLFTVKDIYVYDQGPYFYGEGIVDDRYLELLDCYFVYEWYREYIMGCSAYEKICSVKEMCQRCGITVERYRLFFKIYKYDEDSLSKLYRNKYSTNLIYPIDIYKNGDPMLDSLEESDDDYNRFKGKILEEEKIILVAKR